MKPTSGHVPHPPEEMHNEGVAHDPSDVDIRAIFAFAGIVAVVTIVCSVIVWGLFVGLEHQAAGRDPKMSSLALPAAVMPRTTQASPYFGNAASPQLITDEPAVLRTVRGTEQKAIDEYGWVDQKRGVARLPIDQAKKLLAERGLPSRAAAAAPSLGTHAPAFGEATGGRAIPTGERPAVAPAKAPEQAPSEQPAHAPAGRGGGA